MMTSISSTAPRPFLPRFEGDEKESPDPGQLVPLPTRSTLLPFPASSPSLCQDFVYAVF